jgi:hypothetical protein
LKKAACNAEFVDFMSQVKTEINLGDPQNIFLGYNIPNIKGEYIG